MKDRKRMEGRRKAALTAAGILVSFVLDGGHIAQTAGGILFQPVLFSQQDCV